MLLNSFLIWLNLSFHAILASCAASCRVGSRCLEIVAFADLFVDRSP